MQLLILSDVHGNVSALNRVLEDAFGRFSPDAAALLGDLIDYGMRSDEVVRLLGQLRLPVLCNLWGNHEHAVLTEDYAHFSSERGRDSARRTRRTLSEETVRSLNASEGKSGFQEFDFAGKRFLAIHGSLADPFWKSVTPGGSFEGYEGYDYVLSGHSHLAHAFPVFYEVCDPAMRNKKRTFFINPGSVGQPRNHDPRAQYAVLDTERGVSLCGVDYDIAYEQSLFTDDVDPFYKERLAGGV